MSGQPATCREVVRALQRMQGWAELRHVAETSRDGRIRAMALQKEPKPYNSRLTEFLSHVSEHEVPESTQGLVPEDIDLSHGRPPKPTWAIRALLDHIRRLVRGIG